jgi:hypothetical protein
VPDPAGMWAADRLDLAGRPLHQRLVRVLSHPRSSVLVLGSLTRLPVLELSLTDGLGGLAIAAVAGERSARGILRRLGRSAVAVLSSGVAFRGRRTRGHRNLVGRALRGGLEVGSVTADEYASRAAEMGFVHPPCYPCDGVFLIGSRRGDVLAATHLHVDGDVAQLQAAVHRPGDPLTGPARYAMFQRVIEELASRRVGVLVNLDNYFTLPVGLRTLQRRLDFTPVNLCIEQSEGLGGTFRWRRAGPRAGHSMEGGTRTPPR